MGKLKKCPFCGNKAELVDAGEIRMISVFCTKCGASTEIVDTKDKAIKLWNKRFEASVNPERKV